MRTFRFSYNVVVVVVLICFMCVDVWSVIVWDPLNIISSEKPSSMFDECERVKDRQLNQKAERGGN